MPLKAHVRLSPLCSEFQGRSPTAHQLFSLGALPHPEALRLVANSSTAVADSFRQVSQVTRAAAQRADSLLFNVNLSSNDIALHWYRDKTRDHNSLKDLKSLTIVGVGHSLLAELLNFVGHRTPPNLKVLVVHDPHIWTHNLRMEPTIDLHLGFPSLEELVAVNFPFSWIKVILQRSNVELVTESSAKTPGLQHLSIGRALEHVPGGPQQRRVVNAPLSVQDHILEYVPGLKTLLLQQCSLILTQSPHPLQAFQISKLEILCCAAYALNIVAITEQLIRSLPSLAVLRLVEPTPPQGESNEAFASAMFRAILPDGGQRSPLVELTFALPGRLDDEILRNSSTLLETLSNLEVLQLDHRNVVLLDKVLPVQLRRLTLLAFLKDLGPNYIDDWRQYWMWQAWRGTELTLVEFKIITSEREQDIEAGERTVDKSEKKFAKLISKLQREGGRLEKFPLWAFSSARIRLLH